MFLVNRLVAKAFIPNPNNKTEANHKNGDRMDNKAVNLEWVTRSENQVHAIINGLQKKRNNLTLKEAITVKELHSKGMRQVDIARKFNISQGRISDFVNYKTYR